MFSRPVGHIGHINDEIGDIYFKNINGFVLANDDYSLPATLRALLSKRGESINVEISQKAIDHKENTFIVIIGKDAEKEYSGALENINKTISKFSTLKFYVDTEKHSTRVTSTEYTTQEHHLMQAFMCQLLPWIFKEKPVNEEEKSLLISLSKPVSKDYIDIMTKIEKTFDFSEIIIETKFKNFGTRYLDNQIADAEQEFRCQIENINNYYKYIADCTQTKNELDVKLIGLREKKKNGADNKDLIDFIKRSKENIEVIGVENDTFEFLVKTEITEWNNTIVKRYKDNGVLYDFNAYRDDIEKRKLLVDTLFCDNPKYHVKTIGYYKINTYNSSINSMQNYNYDTDDRIPNPHLQIFACLGNYRRYMTTALTNGDYEQAICICLTSCSSVNMEEINQTISKYLRWVAESTGNVIKTFDGRDITVKEMLEEVKNNKEN